MRLINLQNVHLISQPRSEFLILLTPSFMLAISKNFTSNHPPPQYYHDANNFKIESLYDTKNLQRKASRMFSYSHLKLNDNEMLDVSMKKLQGDNSNPLYVQNNVTS